MAEEKPEEQTTAEGDAVDVEQADEALAKTPPQPTQTTMLTLLIRMTHQSILRRSLKLPRTPHSGPRLMR